MVLSIKIYDKEESVKSFVLGLGLSIMVACFFEIGRLFSYAEKLFTHAEGQMKIKRC